VAAWCEVRVAAGLLWCRGHGGPAFAFGGDGSPIRYPKPWLTIHWILRPHASRSHRVPGDSHATERQSALTDAHVVRSGSRIFAQKPVRTRTRAVRWSAQVDPQEAGYGWASSSRARWVVFAANVLMAEVVLSGGVSWSL
jgi:hypothetical protein